MFKSSGTHFAIVLDEYGLVEGLLTLNDILEAIVGDMPDEDEVGDQRAVQRPDGSWLLDGMLSIDEFQDLFEPVNLPEGDYETLAGFVLTRLGRIPSVADRFEWGGITFEVVDMDGNRVDRLLVARAMGRSERGRSRTRDTRFPLTLPTRRSAIPIHLLPPGEGAPKGRMRGLGVAIDLWLEDVAPGGGR